jgi:hypothetical protein
MRSSEPSAVCSVRPLTFAQGAMTHPSPSSTGPDPKLFGTTSTDAASIVWTLTSPEVHQLLRDVRGWSRQRYVRWLDDSLARTLLAED